MENSNNELGNAEQDLKTVQSYIEGRQYLKQNQWSDAVRHLEIAAEYEYRDAQTQLKKAYYQWGLELCSTKTFQDAVCKFQAAGNYDDAERMLQDARLKSQLESLFQVGMIAYKDKRWKDAEKAFRQVAEESSFFRYAEAQKRLRETQRQDGLRAKYTSLLEKWHSKDFEEVVQLADYILVEIPRYRALFSRRCRDVLIKRRIAKRYIAPKSRDRRLVTSSRLHIVVMILIAFITAKLMWNTDKSVLSLLTEIIIPLLMLILSLAGFYYMYYNRQDQANQRRLRDLQRKCGWLVIVPIGVLVGFFVLACRNLTAESGIFTRVRVTPVTPPVSFPTLTDKPIITSTLTAGASPTLSPTPTQTVTDVPTLALMPTTLPTPLPTPTITPNPDLELLSPEEGQVFESDALIKLEWGWISPLADQEDFEVRIRSKKAKKEQAFRQVALTSSTYHYISAADYGSGAYEWQIAIILALEKEQVLSQIGSFEVH